MAVKKKQTKKVINVSKTKNVRSIKPFKVDDSKMSTVKKVLTGLLTAAGVGASGYYMYKRNKTKKTEPIATQTSRQNSSVEPTPLMSVSGLPELKQSVSDWEKKYKELNEQYLTTKDLLKKCDIEVKNRMKDADNLAKCNDAVKHYSENEKGYKKKQKEMEIYIARLSNTEPLIKENENLRKEVKLLKEQLSELLPSPNKFHEKSQKPPQFR